MTLLRKGALAACAMFMPLFMEGCKAGDPIICPNNCSTCLTADTCKTCATGYKLQPDGKTCIRSATTSIQNWGMTPDNETVHLVTLQIPCAKDPTATHNATFTTYGARWISWIGRNSTNQDVDVLLFYDELEGLFDVGDPAFGSTIGRYANRIANGTFKLNQPAEDGNGTVLKKYNIPLRTHHNGNTDPWSLHGVWNQKVWKIAKTDLNQEGFPFVTFSRTSPGGEHGFPATIDVNVTFTLNNDNAVKIHYHAKNMDEKLNTVLSMTNHAYFNLGTENVLNYDLTLNSDFITPIGTNQLPTGEKRPVKINGTSTPFDFTTTKKVGAYLESCCDIAAGDCSGCDNDQIKIVNGYDTNFVVKGYDAALPRSMLDVATVYSPKSGITLTVKSDQPGVQVYTAQNLKTGSGQGHQFGPYTAICFETQHFPDSPNNPQWPSTELKAGEVYEHETIFQISCEN